MQSYQAPSHIVKFDTNSKWFFLWGLILTTLGLIAIWAATVTTLLSIIFIGMIILLGGAIVTVDSFITWWNTWRGFLLHITMGIIYLIAGIMLIRNPAISSIALTWLLAILFLIIGSFRISYSLFLRLPNWGWSLISGILTLLLGVLILAQWPASGLFVIGLFVGIDLLLCGWTYLMAALLANNRADANII